MTALIHRLRYRLRTVLGRRALEQQLDEELRFHLEMQTSANISLGLAPVTAQAMALRQFGSIAEHKDNYRDRWGARLLETLQQDVLSGIRNLVAHPTMSAAIVAAMALGIGANSAVFTVFNAVVLHPLPFGDSQRLVRLKASMPSASVNETLFSAPEIRDLRAQAGTLSGVAEFHFMYFILLGRDEPARVSAGVVSSNFFSVIDVAPQLGRGFYPEEERAGAPGVIVLSHQFWQRSLKGDPSIVGQSFQMNDRMHTVVGVLPPLPSFPEEADIYLPTSACPLRMSIEADQGRGVRLVSALARVGSGPQGLSRVMGDLDAVAARLRETHPRDYPQRSGFALSAVPVQDDLTSNFRPTLLVLVGAATFLLMILCSSVGALLVARTIGRAPEIAMRAALGAWKGRLFRQFATEAIVLTGAGAVLGLAIAYVGLPPLIEFAERFTPRASEIHMDRSVLLFTLAVTVVTALIFGSMVTLASDADTPGASRSGPMRKTHARQRLFKSLIVLQIAVSFGLLTGAGLMLRSLANLARVDTGLRTHDVLTMRLSLDFMKYTTVERRAALYQEVLDTLARTPDVSMVAAATAVPLVGNGNVGEEAVILSDRVWDERAPRPRVSMQTVSAGYFETLGLAVLDGRAFSDRDDQRSARVAIVNQSMADEHWPGRSPVGEQIQLGDSDRWMTIVGVVADARQRLDAIPMAEVYRPLLQVPPVEARILIRSTLDPRILAERVRTAVQNVEPGQPVESIHTLDDAWHASLAPTRMTATLLSLFAGIALVISAVGIGGVVGSSVSQRTREFGVQMALGAERRHVLLSVLREGLTLALAGLALGLGLSLVLSRSLGGLLYGVAQHDAVTLASVAFVLLLVTLAACFMPARRAASVDPMLALRGV